MIPFHPVANLFPLIEGVEFDDLVNSIKQNGQHDPIVTHDGMILDGRNRYRACIEAAVEPKFETFTGKDHIRFVMDHNIHRRHLNESQRALIAAKLATMVTGDSKSQRLETAISIGGVEISTPRLSAEEAGDLLSVNRATVISAKKVLNEGTEEQIKAIQKGEAAVSTIARQIRAKSPSTHRRAVRELPMSQRGQNPQRIENQRINAQLWAQIRDALNALTGMPLPADVVAIARAHDKTGLVDSKLDPSLDWLREFANAWRDRNEDAA